MSRKLLNTVLGKKYQDYCNFLLLNYPLNHLFLIDQNLTCKGNIMNILSKFAAMFIGCFACCVSHAMDFSGVSCPIPVPMSKIHGPRVRKSCDALIANFPEQEETLSVARNDFFTAPSCLDVQTAFGQKAGEQVCSDNYRGSAPVKFSNCDLSVNQVQKCLELVHKLHFICFEFYSLTYLTKEFTEFINRFGQNYLFAQFSDPDSYIAKFYEETGKGLEVRLQFAHMAKIFDGWIRNRNWDQYQDVLRFVKKRFKVILDDRYTF